MSGIVTCFTSARIDIYLSIASVVKYVVAKGIDVFRSEIREALVAEYFAAALNQNLLYKEDRRRRGSRSLTYVF